MIKRKADAKQIEEFLTSLGKQDWIAGEERQWWPKFLFHYTDIRNVEGILCDGYLYSRSEAEHRGILSVSSGDPNILGETDSRVKDHARLYFRPKTPTQYHAEGIKSKEVLEHDTYPQAHCPVPVFLLFDAVKVLTLADCQFSEGSLRYYGKEDSKLYSTARELSALPWKEIYHNTWHSRGKRLIVFHKNAEAIVPRRLSLDSLRYIVCRTQAEKETLLALLPPRESAEYQSMITATQRASLFYRRHTFVRIARLFEDRIVIEFSPDTRSPGPFHISIEVRAGRRPLKRLRDGFMANSRLALELPRKCPCYRVEVRLDDHLAYAGHYEDIPF